MSSSFWSRWFRSLSGRRTAKRPVRLSVESLETRITPVTKTWTGGGATNDWSIGANWSGGTANTAPVNNDDLLFPATLALGETKTLNNDITNLSVRSIVFAGPNSGAGYTIGGNAITLNATADANTIIANAGSLNNIVSLGINTTGTGKQTLVVNANATLELSGPLTGSVAIAKSGPGTLTLSGDNNEPGQVYSGRLTVSAGVLTITNADALGSTTGDTTVASNAELQLLFNNTMPMDAIAVINEPLLLNGTGTTARGSLHQVSGITRIAGDVTLGTAVNSIGADAGVMDITGQIKDNVIADLAKKGAGQIIFSHVGGNTYRGQTMVDNGILTIRDPFSLGNAAGTPQNGTIVNSNAFTGIGTLQVEFVVGGLPANDPNGVRRNPALPFNALTNPYVGFFIPSEQLTLNGGGFNGQGALQNLVGDNTWAGNVLLGSATPNGSSVTIRTESDTTTTPITPYELTISGVISDPNQTIDVTKTGTGTLVLTNANTYRGTTNINQGIVTIRDSLALGAVGGAGTFIADGAALWLEVDKGFDHAGIRDLSIDSITGQTGNGPQLGLWLQENIAVNGVGFNRTGALRSVSGINYATVPFTIGTANAGIGVDPDPNQSNSNNYFTNDYGLTIGSAEVQTFTVPVANAFTVAFGASSATVLPGANAAAQSQNLLTALNNLFSIQTAGGFVSIVQTIVGNQATYAVSFGRFLAGVNVPLLVVNSGGVGVAETSRGGISSINGNVTVLRKLGGGQLILPNRNDYRIDTLDANGIRPSVQFDTEIEQGWVTIRNARALGDFFGDPFGAVRPTISDTLQPGTRILAGAALHLKPLVADQSINLVENLSLAGIGVSHPFALIDQKGSIVNLGGVNTIGGPVDFGGVDRRKSSDVTVVGQSGIGVELVGPDTTSELTITGTISEATPPPINVNGNAGGNFRENVNVIDVGATAGSITITADVLPAPDSVRVYLGDFANDRANAILVYDSVNDFVSNQPVPVNRDEAIITVTYDSNTATASAVETTGTGWFLGPKVTTYPTLTSSFISIVVNQGDNPNNGITQWSYTASIIANNNFSKAGITKLGSRLLTLHGDANYTGDTIIAEGTLKVQNDTALGQASTGTASGTQTYSDSTTSIGAGTTEVQTVTVAGAVGNFTLTFNGETTSALTTSATAAQVSAALNLLPGVIKSGGSISVNQSGNVYGISFGSGFAGLNQAQLIANPDPGVLVTVRTLLDGNGSALLLTEGAAVNNGGVTGGLNIWNEQLELSGRGFSQGEEQLVTLSGNTAGLFRLTFRGATTTDLSATASADEVQAALNALATVGDVGGSTFVLKSGTSYLIRFIGGLLGENVPDLVAVGSGGANTLVTQRIDGDRYEPLTILSGDHLWHGPVQLSGSPIGEIQTVALVGNTGSFKLTFNTFETPTALPFNASAADVEAALNALPSIAGIGGTVQVSKDTTRNIFTITFGSSLLGQDVGQITATSLTGGLTATPTTLTQGRSGSFVQVQPSTRVTFGSGISDSPVAEVQTVTIVGNTGTFTLSFNGATTSDLSATATKNGVMAALQVLSTIGGVGGTVTVEETATDAGKVFTITFGGTLTGFNLLPITAKGTGMADPSVATSRNGARGSDLTLSGGGQVALQGANTFMGTVFVKSGVLVIENNAALGDAGTGEDQQITVVKTGTAAGTFQLRFNGQPTTALNDNATPAEIQTALNALSTIGGLTGGFVNVTGGTGGVYRVVFGGSLVGYNLPDIIPTNVVGPLTVTGATVIDGTGATLVSSNASLQVKGSLNVNEPLTLQGQGAGSQSNVPLRWFQTGPAGTNVNDLPDSQTAGTQAVSGRGTSIAADPRDVNVIYISTSGGGVWKTENGGKTWQPLFDLRGGRSEVQRVTVTGSTGTFRLTFDGQQTLDIPVGATALQVQTALNRLSSVGGKYGSVSVTKSGDSTTGNRYDVTFLGGLANADLVLMTATPATVVVTVVTEGQQPNSTPEVQKIAVNTLTGTVRFTFDGDQTGPIDLTSATLAQDIEDALNALPSIQGTGPTLGRVTVTANPGGNTFAVTFLGGLQGINVDLITDNSGNVNVTTTMHGTTQANSLYGGAIAISPLDSRVLYYATGEANESDDATYGTGVYRSNDSGRTWTLLIDDAPVPRGATDTRRFDEGSANPLFGMAVTAITIDPLNDDVIYVSASNRVGKTPSLATNGTPGVYRYDPSRASAKWFNLTAVASAARSDATDTSSKAGAQSPFTPGPEDYFNFSFPQQNATWSDVSVIHTIIANFGAGPGFPVPVVYAALGANVPDAGTRLGTQQSAAVFRIENPESADPFNDPIWVMGNPAAPTNEVQTITLTNFSNAASASGTYRLSFNGAQTIILNSLNDLAIEIQNALNALATIIAQGGVTVTGPNQSNFNRTYTITFNNSLANQPQITGQVIQPGPQNLMIGSGTTTQGGSADDRRPGTFANGAFPAAQTGNTDNGNIKLKAFIPTPSIFDPGNVRDAVIVFAAIANPNTNNNATFKGIFRSGSGGEGWAAVGGNPANYMGNQGDYNSAFLALNSLEMYVGGFENNNLTHDSSIYRTTNGFGASTNVSLTGNGPGRSIHYLAADAQGRVLAGTDGGIWRYDAVANTWTDINGNLAISQVNSVALNPTDPNVAFIGTRFNGTQIFTDGLAWDLVDGDDAGMIIVDPRDSTIVYHVKASPNQFGSNNFDLRRSDQGGAAGTWVDILSNVPLTRYPPFVIDAVDNRRVIVGANNPFPFTGPILQESLSSGAPGTWVNLDSALPLADVTGLSVASFQGAFVPDGSFTAITDRGSSEYDPDTIYVTDGSTVFVTKNHGVSWADRTSTLIGLGGIGTILVDPANRDTAYVTRNVFDDADGKVFRTTNAGRGWTDVTFNLPNAPVYKLVLDSRNGNLYVATESGVWRLTAGTTSWERLGLGLVDVKVTDLALNATTNRLVAGTYGRSVYELFLDDGQAGSGALRAVSGTTVWTGTVRLQADGTTPVVIASNGSQALPGIGVVSASVNFVGSIRDFNPLAPPLLVKDGTGDVIFSGTNTYGGITEINQGALTVRNPQALGLSTADTLVKVGTALQLESNLDDEPIRLNGNGVQPVLNGHESGALRNVANLNTYTGQLTLQTNATIGVDSGSQLTISGTGTITDGANTFTLTKELKGTLILASANTYDGQTIVNQGVLAVADANALGLGGNTLAAGTLVRDGAQLQTRGGIAVASERLTLSGTGIDSTGALLNFSGDNTWAGNVSLAVVPSFSPTSYPLGATSVGVGANATLTLSGIIDDVNSLSNPVGNIASGLAKVGAGMLVLSGQNTYGGTTYVTTGTVRVASNNALGGTNNNDVQRVTVTGSNAATFALTFKGFTTIDLDFDATAAEVENALEALASIGTNNVTVSRHVVTTAVPGGTPVDTFVFTVRFQGIFTGLDQPLMTVLGQDGTTAFVTSVAEGQTGTLVSTGAVLEIDGRAANLAIPVESIGLNGNGSGTGVLKVLGGDNTLAGGLVFYTNGATKDSRVDVAANSSLSVSGVVQDYVPLTIPVSVPAGGLNKTGLGTLAFSGTNTYTGTTLVNAGILNVSNNSGLGAGSFEAQTLTVFGASGTFRLSIAGPIGTETTIALDIQSPTLRQDIQNALNALKAIGGGVTVLQGAVPNNNVFTVRFNAVRTADVEPLGLGNQPQLVAIITPGVTVDVATLRDGPEGTVVASGATLQVQGNINVLTERLTLNGTGVNDAGALQNVSGNNQWGRPILLGSAVRIGSESGTLNVTGPISAVSSTISNVARSAAGVATIITTTNSNFAVGQQLLITGLTNTSFNGLWTVASVSGNTVTFASPGTPLTPTTDFGTAVSPTTAGDARTVTKVGAGNLQYSAANTYTGDTFINEGGLFLNSTTGNATYGRAVLSDVFVGDNATGAATLRLLQDNQLPDSGLVRVVSDGLFDYNGRTETIQALTVIDGAVESGNNGSLAVTTTNLTGGTIALETTGARLRLLGDVTATSSDATGPATINGPGAISIQGAERTFDVLDGTNSTDLLFANGLNVLDDLASAFGITKIGAGRLEVDTIYLVPTTINQGDVQVDGSIQDVALTGGSLSGIGSFDSILGTGTAIGVIAPGDNAASAVTGGIGSLTTTGSSTLAGSTSLSFDLDSDAAGAGVGYDQLRVVGGTLDLNDAVLAGLATTNVLENDTFTIIQASGGGEITGFFEELYDPNVVYVSGQKFLVTYNRGPDGSVVLTRVLASVTVDLVSSHNPAPYGETLFFTATITPQDVALFAPVPPFTTAQVEFSIDEDGDLNTPPLTQTLDVTVNSDRTSATVTFDPQTFLGGFISLGTHRVSARFLGDANLGTGDAIPVDQIIEPANTTTTVAATPSPSTPNPAVFGQTIIFTANVVPVLPSGGVPTNTVTFTLDGNVVTPDTMLVNGVATFSRNDLNVGFHTLVATYNSDGNYLTSTSTQISFEVVRNFTTVVIDATPSPSVFGQQVTFTATVSPVSPGSGTPTGMVTFYDGDPDTTGVQLGTTQTLSGGSAFIDTSVLSRATHQIFVVYSGDPNFQPVKDSRSFTVDQANTTTALMLGSTTRLPGQPLQVTATVTAAAPGAGLPSGKVRFLFNGVQHGPDADVNQATGVATLSITDLDANTYSVTAVYVGDTNFVTSTSAAQSLTVTQGPTVTTVVTSKTPEVRNVAVTFTATVAPQGGATRPVTGVVIFYDGSLANPLGQANVNPLTNTASLPVSSLTVGDHTIIAVFQGDANYTGSSGAVAQMITPNSSTTTIVNPGSLVVGQSFPLTVNVVGTGAGTGQVPTSGTVTVVIDGNTASPLTLTVGANGVAQVPFAFSLGSHTIDARFNGNTDFAASTAARVTVNVAPSPSAVTALTVPARITARQNVTVSATVVAAAPGGGIPTGQVTFTMDGTFLGNATLDAAGKATLTFNNPFLDGTHTVTATYAGSASYQTSAASANTSVVPFSNQIFAVGAGLGSIPAVKVYDALTGAERFSFFAYDTTYVGGVRVGVGDVNGDGFADVIVGVTPTQAGSPALNGHVKVFDGKTGQEIRSFFARPGSRAGIFVAVGDVNGDGFGDMIVGGDAGEADGRVTVFSGNPAHIAPTGVPTLLREFRAYANFNGGVRVAGGDVDGDGFADVITGSGFGAAPAVKVISGATGVVVRSFLAYDEGFKGEVFVSAANLNNDRFADILTTARTPSNGSHVRAFDALVTNAGVYPPATVSYVSGDRTGAGLLPGSVAAVDRSGDGISEVLITFAGRPSSTYQTLTLGGAVFAAPVAPFPGFQGDIFIG